MRNPYTVLGVARSADEKQIKTAFRSLAKRYHPDHNKDDAGAKEKFSEINQAYEILGDKDKRAAYDRGEIDEDGKPKFAGGFGGGDFGGARGARGNPFGGGGFDFSGMGGGGRGNIHIDESILNDIFGGGRADFGGGRAGPFGRARHSPPRRGADIAASLHVTAEQLVGAEKVEALFPDGRRLKIKLPDYLEDGQTIRLKGQGEPAPGGASGDALVTVHFKLGEKFRLEGRILHMDLPVPLRLAVLGGKQEVQTADGALMVGIPAWSGSDKVLRLRDKGLRLKEGGRAPLYIHLRLMLPAEPDKELEDWAEKSPA